ncbi:MAG: hypothetical protein E6J69_12865 [Deltaproteobacteria bacterium]|nr:MAG: hypothetical protein E6J69_12865 [Deltaproteobacteria bacterium]TMB43461.1 MAG: hypothetical protein E6J55_12850 [Deltaproteobacteria bacterium]
MLVALAAAAGGLAGRAGGVVLGGGAIGLSVALYVVALGAFLRSRRSRLAIGILFVKLAALLGLGWLAFASRRFHPDPIGFAVGVSCFPVAAVWEGLRARGG